MKRTNPLDVFVNGRCRISGQTRLEEVANVITHRISLLLSIVAFVVLVSLAGAYGSAIHIVAVGVFGVSLVLLFLALMLYHGADVLPRKQLYRTLDHMAIYLVIAGTYTPFMLVLHQETVAWPLFWTLWGTALLGIIVKRFFTGRFVLLSTLTYVAMGWLGVFAVPALKAHLSPTGFALVLIGGAAYTVGAVVYLLKRIPFHHAAWHAFVTAGAGCHYAAVLTILLNGAAQ